MNPMKDLEIKQMDSKREMEMMDALDQVRASNARIDKASRDLDPEAILKLVRWDEEETETEEQRLEREDAELARKTFAGLDGEIVRRTAEDSVSTEKITPSSLLQPNVAVPHVFAKPLIRKRKESGMNALGVVKKKKTLI